MWPNLRKGTFFIHKIWPIFWTLKFHNFFILAYTSLKLSMVVAKVSGYSLVLWASWSAYVVKSYIILFDGMSNVWKRYLFANPVTYSFCMHGSLWNNTCWMVPSISLTLPEHFHAYICMTNSKLLLSFDPMYKNYEYYTVLVSI